MTSIPREAPFCFTEDGKRSGKAKVTLSGIVVTIFFLQESQSLLLLGH